jgi:hypothetical protein
LPEVYDGFWFPSSVRNRIITPNTSYAQLHFSRGSIVPASSTETVTVRWPHLDLADWRQVIGQLQDNRRRAQGQDWRERLPQAVRRMRDTWLDQANPLRQQVLQALTSCTGHSTGMLDLALGFLDLVSVDDLQRAASYQFTQEVRGKFVSLDGLPGRIRFFDDTWWQRVVTRSLLQFASYHRRPWHLQSRPSDLIVGYAAGNVPGTGLLLILLGLAAAARKGSGPPLILVKNSSREPIFTPLVLTALELIDPSLLDTTLVTLWDYNDVVLQQYLLGQADLAVAAASDETIDAIGRIADRVSRPAQPLRFHRHGHKVSFSTISHECLAVGQRELATGVPLVDAVALLASLDVALWNQQGCLSSRVHFVERGHGPKYHTPDVYGRAVVESLRTLESLIPKGISRKRTLHNLFDKYQAMAVGGQVEVLSGYDDDFLVVLDRRSLTTDQFREVVNDCHGRTVVIVPVDDVMDVPHRYLRHLRREHLQSMSVALGDPHAPGTSARLLHYAEALGAVGVTGIRTVGRGAFPQLTHSWDGLIPLDLTVERPKGYFTALEFDEPWTQIGETYGMVREAIDAQGRVRDAQRADSAASCATTTERSRER